MTLGSVPLGRMTTRVPSAASRRRPVGGRHAVGRVRLGQVGRPRPPASRRASPAAAWRTRAMVAGICARSVNRADELVGQVQAVPAGEVVEQVDQGAPGGLGARRELGQQERRRQAVLVPHVAGVAAVAEGLLVAERQAVGPGDPLEAGQGLARARGRAPRRSGRAAGRTRSSRPARRRRPRGDAAACSPSSAPTSSPCSIRQLAGVRVQDRGGAAVGVRVVGDHQVGLDAAGEVEREVDRAGLLGVGERDGREVRVGLGLLRHRRAGR